ncbi:MAG: cell division protein FtsZ [Alphaproteobacteria bacterium]|nr:cell division protein FtsZ [Alphaproteobacteria bacterium]
MSGIELDITEQQFVLAQPKITVVGVGGAGGNAINNMIQSKLEGVEFVAANTDAQALSKSLAEHKIQLGAETTKGQGAGARPEVGKESAEEAEKEIANALDGANMVFITAGMGGGTGTGAAPIVAKMARERDILTVGVVTKPFTFEGRHRMATAERGIEELAQYVDTLIVIPNQNLFLIADEQMTFSEAFKRADEVLQSGVRSITDLIITPGIINLDFSDVRAVMSEMGRAMMGTGIAEGEGRGRLAAEAAINNPLLDNSSMHGAKGILINIAGGDDLTLFEVDEAANRIREEVDPEANIIFGASRDEALAGQIRVSVVATGITNNQSIDPTIYTQPGTTSKLFDIPKSSKPITKPISTFKASTVSKVETHVEPKAQETVQEPIAEIPSLAQTNAPAFSLTSTPTPTQAPVQNESANTQSTVIPAMPSATDFFGTTTKQQPSFDISFPNQAPSFMAPEFSKPEEPVVSEPAPQPAPIAEPLFALEPVVSMPSKPAAREEKPHNSFLDFVTRRNKSDDVVSSADNQSDLPDFLRH